MQKFSDGQQDWPIEINLGAVKRVLVDTGINLSLPHEANDGDQTLAERLVFDVITQVDVIWSLVRPTADSRSITMDKFLELCKPEVLKLAYDAFHQEWRDFFRKLGQTVQQQIVEQAQKLRDELQVEGTTQLNRLNTAKTTLVRDQMKKEVDLVLKQIDELNQDAILSGSSASATNSPDASEDSEPKTLTA